MQRFEEGLNQRLQAMIDRIQLRLEGRMPDGSNLAQENGEASDGGEVEETNLVRTSNSGQD